MGEMTEHGHLMCRLVSLKSPAEWEHKQEGLAFLFPERGNGRFVCGRRAERVLPKDVVVSVGGRGGRLSVAGRGEAAFRAFWVRLEHLFPLFAAEEISLLDDLVQGFQGFKVYAGTEPLARECQRLACGVGHEFNL